MSWISTPEDTKWPEHTPDGVKVDASCRTSDGTRTGCGHPWSERDRKELLALPGAIETGPLDCEAVSKLPLRERCLAHALNPGVAIRRVDVLDIDPHELPQKLTK